MLLSAADVCGIVLGRSLGLLQPTGVHVTSESVRLLEAVQNASQALRDCEAGFQMWRLFETRKWRTLMASCDIIDRQVQVILCQVTSHFYTFPFQIATFYPRYILSAGRPRM